MLSLSFHKSVCQGNLVSFQLVNFSLALKIATLPKDVCAGVEFNENTRHVN